MNRTKTEATVCFHTVNSDIPLYPLKACKMSGVLLNLEEGAEANQGEGLRVSGPEGSKLGSHPSLL